MVSRSTSTESTVSSRRLIARAGEFATIADALIPADPELKCQNAFGEGPCYDSFAAYLTRLPSGRMVYELPTARETLPNGASYLVIDHLDQMLDHMPEITVPKDHVFLMGDNRDHSADSRASLEQNGLGGPVPLSDIGGRAEFVTFSFDGTESWNPLTWWGALRDGRAWQSLRPRLDTPPGGGAAR